MENTPRGIVWILVAAAAAILSSANSLHGDYVIDDHSAVRTNGDLRPETPLRSLLTHDFWGRPLDAPMSNKSYRPLTVLSFRLNFVLHGLEVFGYHLGNVLLHAACTALVYVTCMQLLAPGDAVAARIASLAFAVHPVHAEAVASIVGRAEGLCCVFYLLCLLCYARGAAPLTPPRQAGAAPRQIVAHGGGSHGTKGAVGARLLWLLGAAILGVLATASKEVGLTAYPTAAALDVFAALRPSSSHRSRWLCGLRCLVFAGVTLLLLIGSRRIRGADLSPHFSFVDNPLPSLPTFESRLLTTLHVHVVYAKLLLWPTTLSADYSFDCLPAVATLHDPRNLSSAALYFGLGWIGGAALHARRCEDSDVAAALDRAPREEGRGDGERGSAKGSGQAKAKSRRAGIDAGVGSGGGSVKSSGLPLRPPPEIWDPSLQGRHHPREVAVIAAGRCLFLVLFPLLPASHAFLGIGTLVAERLLYTPSVGYCALVGVTLAHALRTVRQHHRDSAVAADQDSTAAGQVAALGVGALGEVWVLGPLSNGRRRRGTWYVASLTLHAILCLGFIVGFGRLWLRNRDWATSDSITAATVSACPGSAKAQVSLGTMHLQRGAVGEAATTKRYAARTAFRTALSIHPQYPDALYWLGRVAFIEGRLSDAEPLLLAALERNGGLSEAHLFAALCAARRGSDRDALERLGRAHALAPHNAEIVRDYGAMMLRVGQPVNARPLLERSVHLLSELHRLSQPPTAHSRGSLSSALVKLAACYLLLNLHSQCLASCVKAQQLEPSLVTAVTGLRGLCERGKREGLNTSSVKLDLAL